MPNKLSHSKFLIPFMICIAVLAVGTGFYISLKQAQQAQGGKPDIEGLYWPTTKQIGDFNLLNQDNQPFTKNNLENKWSFVFFGYTHCPDICPITMSVMADVNKKLENTTAIQTLFVTVDPERDTTEKLKQYVGYFNPEFIGLGGDMNMINSLTGQIGIAHYRSDKDTQGYYSVDHTGSIFLIGPKLHLVAKLSQPHQAEAIVGQFKQIRDFIDAQ